MPAKTRNQHRLIRIRLFFLIFLSCIFLPFVLHIPFTPTINPTLPSRVSTLLPHIPHPSSYPPPPPPDWKRPLTLTVHARPTNTSVLLTLFSTGVDNDTYNRTFHAVGCLIGNTAYPLNSLKQSQISCIIPANALVPAVPITILLQADAFLFAALREPQERKREIFKLDPEDVSTPLEEHVRIMPGLNFTHDNLAAIGSLVVWNDAFLDPVDIHKPKYELCIMTVMKQYKFLLDDWVDYYRRMGVDYFYIYENAADTDIKAHFKNNPYVEVMHWPWSRSQVQSNNHFLLASKSRCRYTVWFDADEYVMVGDNRPAALKRYLMYRFAQGYSQVVFHFIMMLNNGFVRRPKGHLPELYTRREKDQQIKLGKTSIQTDRNWNLHKIHLVEGVGEKTYWNTTLELNPQSLAHNSMLVHYTRRSWEDFCAKNLVGGASVMTSGRKPTVLDVNKPDPEYMDTSKSLPWTAFRDRYQHIRRETDHGGVTLSWREQGHGTRYCRQVWCPTCWGAAMGNKNCN